MSKAQWQEEYSSMVKTADEAVKTIKSGQRVFVGTGCAQPEELVKALVNRGTELVDTEIVHLLTLGHAPYADEKLTKNFRVNSFFIAKNVRDIIQEGLGDYTPIFLSDIPRLFSSGQLPIDVALVQVTPPDDKGMCSLGISVDIVKSAIANSQFVIAQVNPQMPRTNGESSISIYDLDVLVPSDQPLIEVEMNEPTAEAEKIGEYVAALVEDGSTIEFGIGEIPQAVVPFLKDKKHLGIHTEMFTDAIIDLVESGAVDGSRKSIDKGKVVASFCMGTRRLYEYINENEQFQFHPTEYVNDPFIIGSGYKQVAINVALEVDLTGQVCADSLGKRFYSGIGGQVDFNRGAARSEGGKCIIALPSTAKNGTVSRIKAILDDGAGVVTTRGDVQYVVTEYGVAYLHGKSVQERAIALISIAHPKFRAELTREAVAARYLRPDHAAIEGKIVVGPKDYNTVHIMDDGTMLSFRAMHPTDEPRLTDLIHALSKETMYYRFMHQMKTVERKEIQNFVYINHRTDVAIVATLPEAHGDEIVAIGRYYLDQSTNKAELAFVVRDEWQNKGIGSALFKHLSLIAIRNGIAGFTAEVLRENIAMQSVINKSEFDVTSKPSGNVYSFNIKF
ncbi:MAG: GNAT family N-acetyltransferase [Deltaproteobacteria bacterium]|nr:GNAT family N-acetyltransferase [Deltaproteobacteria bacterium]MBN2674109.1 GNAT family N-acetyltransferase [Deltaproteobacteria bacterium]